MKAPGFWFAPPAAPGLAARLLAPMGALYAAATARRLARGARWRPGVAVICVGNLAVGGTGKTPAVIAIVQALAARGIAAHVVSRGHGGRLGRGGGPVTVDCARHTAADVGDEPLLLAAFAPVHVGRDRAGAARLAVAAGARAVVLDDGFQNPALAHDLAIVVVDAEAGFGNRRVLPAGPLREPVAVGLARADLVLAVGERAAAMAAAREGWMAALPAGLPLATARLVPLATGIDWAGVPVYAFAGIGRPEKVFATLRALGADLRGARALADHQPLTPALMARLGREAAAAGAQLVTTEKDAVRLPPGWRAKVLALPVRLETTGGEADGGADGGADGARPLEAALDRLAAGISS